MEKLSYAGVFNGFAVTYTKEYSGIGDDIPNADDFIQATAWLETNGFKPAAVMPVSNGTVHGNPAPFTSAPAAAANWACPTHGAEKIKAGYQGRGWECSVSSQQQPPWPNRPFNGRNGTIYYCSQKSQ